MTEHEQRLADLMAMTPELEAEGWRGLETAPHDGTEIELRLVHAYASWCKDPVAEGYIATARARWIDHNRGGFTWHGLCGRPAQWRPLPAGEGAAEISAREMMRIARRAAMGGSVMSVPVPVLAALGRLNQHARARGVQDGQPKAIYAYKTVAALLLAAAGEVSLRFVKWTGTCNRCTNGRFRHWDWDDGHTVACRDCGGTGKRTLRFTETTLPDGQRWHHPWFVGDGKGLAIAYVAYPGLAMDDHGEYWTGEGVRLVWSEPGDWAPNLPAHRLPLADLVPLLNAVEDWIEGLPNGGPISWQIEGAKRRARNRDTTCFGDPLYSYQLDLGRAPGGCFVCGSDDLAGFTYGRVTRSFHWSLPVCKRHSEGPDKVPHPKDPPPEILITPDIARWRARHERVEAAS